MSMKTDLVLHWSQRQKFETGPYSQHFHQYFDSTEAQDLARNYSFAVGEYFALAAIAAVAAGDDERE